MNIRLNLQGSPLVYMGPTADRAGVSSSSGSAVEPGWRKSSSEQKLTSHAGEQNSQNRLYSPHRQPPFYQVPRTFRVSC